MEIETSQNNKKLLQKQLETISKTQKKIKISRIIMMICNTLAALFIYSIYIFFIQDIAFIVIASVIVFLNIPVYIVFKKIEKKIEDMSILNSKN